MLSWTYDASSASAQANLLHTLAVYLHREPIDFRKNISGLAALVALTCPYRSTN